MEDRNFGFQVFLIFVFAACATAQNVFVVAPNTFRLDSEETVGVLVYSGKEEVKLFLQDYPGRKHTFSEIRVNVSQNEPQVVGMQIKRQNIPNLELSTDLSKHYVLLVAEGRKFRKEVKVLVTLQAGYLFVQTDKPIYTPKQTVHVRVIPLGEAMLPDNQNFTLQIRNPQDVIVDHVESTKLAVKNGLYSYNFKFPPVTLCGEWSVVIKYGHKVQKNETVKFEMKEYALPTFEVKLKVPQVILPHDEIVSVQVEAKYVYGQTVEGAVLCKFGVKLETGKTIYFGRTDTKLLQNGHAKCNAQRDYFEKHNNVGWFPGIAGSHFVVEAIVTEKATGEQEKATNSEAILSKTKYLVDFKRCLKDFKPGYAVTVQAEIKEATGKTASGVKTIIEVKNEQGRVMDIGNSRNGSLSNADGKIVFIFPTERSFRTLYIKVITDDPDLPYAVQGKGIHIMVSHKSPSYVTLERTNVINAVQVGSTYFFNVYSQPSDLAISFVVTSGGRVLELGSLTDGEVDQRSLKLLVKDTMVPSIRITLFATYQSRMLTDSIKIDVQKICRKQAQIVLESHFLNAEPGAVGNITVRGTQDTVVGLLAVDKAVYALRNKGLLTKDKMFSKMEEHDLGCGPGGGSDSQQVLANAGLVVISDTSVSAPERLSCTERRIMKRAIREDAMSQHTEGEKFCCKLGTYRDLLNRDCEERADIIRKFHRLEEHDKCADAYLSCCLKTRYFHLPKHFQTTKHLPHLGASGPKEKDLSPLAKAGLEDHDLEFVEEENDLEHELDTTERKDFRETWLFDSGVIGNNNQLEVKATVPHSITTWMIQALAINPHEGMCVADPAEVVIFKKIFMQLKLPYSVVRNEQIEIRATVFNYGERRVPIVLYMYGVEGLCSEAQPNEKSERKKVYVSGKGGTETVAFPIVPLEVGEFEIKVVAVSPLGNDVITKKLHVVAEGSPYEENIVLVIDPANLDKRKRRSIVSDKYKTSIDAERKQQVTEVKVTPGQDYIPGTEACYITAIGDKFGATVHTALNNPDKLIRLPQGCGEQTMAFLAPTLYTMHYLKITGKLTAQQETNGHKYVREGYQRELTFRKVDGSYAAFINRNSSTWLTAFVAKVFCQASKYVFIDENTVCSALDWLTNQQHPDGSFIENNPVIHHEMTGGIRGTIPMTAFVVNAFYKCDCNGVDLAGAKESAVAHLREALDRMTDPYHLAITAYALSLADPAEAGFDANQRLLAISKVDEELNLRYWGMAGTALSVEATSYALLTQLIHNNHDIAASIVNWLNTQRTIGGAFWSTQDTVIALEALAEYAITTRDPEMSLSCNMSSTNDVKFRESFQFQAENARVLRSYELKKFGGKLSLEAAGTGVSNLVVQLRYNVPKKVNQVCKFDIKAEVTEAKEPEKDLVDLLGIDWAVLNAKPPVPVDDVPEDVGDLPPLDEEGSGDIPPAELWPAVKSGGAAKGRHNRHTDIPHRHKVKKEMPRFKRKVDEKKDFIANISICVTYLSDTNSNMAIIDAGIFSGFRVNETDLKRIVNDSSLPVQFYEKTSRSIVFYLDKISHVEPTCFWFKARQEFIVGNMESSVIKVVDYYDPRHTCSIFYSATRHSPILQTKCTGFVCHCAEGGCPPANPFENVLKENTLELQRNALLKKGCEDHDFVWKVEVESIEADSTFLNINVNILIVLKEGWENRETLQDAQRTFLSRKTCQDLDLVEGDTYIIMGKDKRPIREDGIIKYLYYINKQTAIYNWFDIRDSSLKRTPKEIKLQKHFISFEKEFSDNKGCSH